MTMSKTTGRILIVAVAVTAVWLAVQAFAASRFGNESPGRYWLSQFEGGPVAVTFVKAPPGKEQVAEGRLILAEASGLVLRFPKETDKFFSYANLISVDPK